MPLMRAKFQVQSITHHHGYHATTLKATAVYSGSPEDNSFAQATPSGTLELSISNPATRDLLKLGDKFYMDFTKAEE
jgi:hypothetical protein